MSLLFVWVRRAWRRLHWESVSLTEILRECENMIEPQAQKRGISVFFPRFDQPKFLKADRIRANQVLINMISNAIKCNGAVGTVIQSTLSVGQMTKEMI